MAFQEYASTEAVHSMTTRQLRKYISDKGAEAQERINTMNVSEQSQAVKDAIHFITKGTNSRVYKGTSNLTKSEMREMADQLRIFNRLDTESGYAQDREYETNKARYEKFITNRAKKAHWKDYIQDGKVSKEGYAEYKKYINLLKDISGISKKYNYQTILTKATKQLATGQDVNKRLEKMADILDEVFNDANNKGLSSSQLTNKFFEAWFDYETEQHLKRTVSKTDIQGKPEKYKPKGKSKPKNLPSSKRSKQKSKSDIKVKQAGKMKTNATIHR